MTSVAYVDFGGDRHSRSLRMENQKQGHFSIFRSLLTADWAKDTAKFTLWVRLIGQASHKARKVRFNNVDWDLMPGQLVTKFSVLARVLRDTEGNEKSVQQVRRMLEFFEKEGMISFSGNRFGTVISVKNYADYQADFAGGNIEDKAGGKKPSNGEGLKVVPGANTEASSEEHEQEGIKQELKDKPPLPPKGDNSEQAIQCLDFYNQVTDSRCSSTDAFEKALSKVKAKGVTYSVEEIKLVIRWAFSTWNHKPSPNNLCRMTRFDSYLSNAIIWSEGVSNNPNPCPHETLVKLWNEKFPERIIEINEWNKSRPAYQGLERIWNGKTTQGAWREVKHIGTLFNLIRQSTLTDNLHEKYWLNIDWILDKKNWAKVYEQVLREYRQTKQGI